MRMQKGKFSCANQIFRNITIFTHPEKGFFDLKKCFFAVRLKKKFL